MARLSLILFLFSTLSAQAASYYVIELKNGNQEIKDVIQKRLISKTFADSKAIDRTASFVENGSANTTPLGKIAVVVGPKTANGQSISLEKFTRENNSWEKKSTEHFSAKNDISDDLFEHLLEFSLKK